ncbi:MarR family winged helix-turn-helix transcriptional regulator [Alteribacillus sp. HJP-4]|uniref:MarR family winged helix-turn-helix transcriptional regulator n=1 Tax=Alteribacillus sp. HJP-4 TaxID=2775394 RepID=UPI0035CD27CE
MNAKGGREIDKQALLKAIDDAIFDMSVKINEEFGGAFPHIPEKYKVVLILISRYKTLYVKDIAEMLHVSSSSASQLLSKMEKEQFIKRELDPGQRRQTFVKPGRYGEEITKKMMNAHNEITSKYLLRLPQEDLEAFHRIALKLKDIVVLEREAEE